MRFGSQPQVVRRSTVSSKAVAFALLGAGALVVGALAVWRADGPLTNLQLPGQTAPSAFRCTQVPLSREIVAGLEMSWAPSGATLAATQIAARSSPPSEVLLIEGSSWTPRSIGSGAAPRWSGSGSWLSAYAEPSMRVLDGRTGAEIARVAATSPATGWKGDELRYWSGNEIHAWTSGGDRRLAIVRLADFPSLAFEPTLSSDGDFFAITRFDFAGAATDLYLGRTSDGSFRRESPPSRGYQWSRAGHGILLQQVDRLVFRSDPLGDDHVLAAQSPVFFGWDPAGQLPLVGSEEPTSPLILRSSDGSRTYVSYEVPRDIGVLAFTRDGGYAATTTSGPRSRTLLILRCTP